MRMTPPPSPNKRNIIRAPPYDRVLPTLAEFVTCYKAPSQHLPLVKELLHRPILKSSKLLLPNFCHVALMFCCRSLIRQSKLTERNLTEKARALASVT